MNKIIYSLIFCSFTTSVFYDYDYKGSTIAAVTLAGGVVSAQHSSIDKKYKRKDCPVCKGKGWYISGDDITKVPCGYCENESEESTVTHPPIILRSSKNPPTRVFKK